MSEVAGHSVWLMPQGALADRLAARICNDSVAASPFLPHITVVGQLPHDPTQLDALLHELAAGHDPIEITLGDRAVEGEWFRASYLHADSADLLTLHAHACRLFDCDPAGYRPHLSLRYGPPEAEATSGVDPETGARFTAHELVLWHTEGPVANWIEAARFPL